MHDEAVAAAQRGVELTDGNYPLALSILFHVYVRANRRQEAMRTFEQLHDVSKNSYVSPCVMAGILGQLGRMDEAFHWLEKAFLDHDHWLVLMKVNPLADSLRSDPRFSEIMKRIGLEK
jgi:tetratricopeptide (TPR) repeat protein